MPCGRSKRARRSAKFVGKWGIAASVLQLEAAIRRSGIAGAAGAPATARRKPQAERDRSRPHVGQTHFAGSALKKGLVRTKKRVKSAAQVRITLAEATFANQRCVSERLADGRWFRILTIVDQYTRECLCMHADRSQTAEKVAEQLERLITLRGAPESITSDNGSEFTGKAMDHWAHQAGVKLNFIRPGKPIENSYIESFNGRLRDECLNVEVFLDLADARRKLDQWRNDYNRQRPHGALADRTPDEFASVAMQRTSPKRPFVLRGSSELL